MSTGRMIAVRYNKHDNYSGTVCQWSETVGAIPLDNLGNAYCPDRCGQSSAVEIEPADDTEVHIACTVEVSCRLTLTYGQLAAGLRDDDIEMTGAKASDLYMLYDDTCGLEDYLGGRRDLYGAAAVTGGGELRRQTFPPRVSEFEIRVTPAA